MKQVTNLENVLAELDIMLQTKNELYFAEKHVAENTRQELLENEELVERRDLGVKLLQDWIGKWTAAYTDQCNTEEWYKQKKDRVNQIAQLDLVELTTDVLVLITMYCEQPELFVSVTAQLAAKLSFNEKRESIQTIAEIVSVLSETDLFDLTKSSPRSSVRVLSKIKVSLELQDLIARSQYMPPMVCKPGELKHNHESPYLTYNECQILGKQNGHTEDICLDVINIQNQVPLKLDVDFLSLVEEIPKHSLDTTLKVRNWKQFKKESDDTYQLMLDQGNRFYIPNRPDKRGRLYASGYHITPQGTAYKKAMIEFANEEIVKGVEA